MYNIPAIMREYIVVSRVLVENSTEVCIISPYYALVASK